MNIDKVLGRLSRSGSVVDDDIRSLFFGDYSNPEGSRDYDEITDLKQLTKVIEQYVSLDTLTISVRQAAVAAQHTMTFQYDRPLERHS